MVEWTAYVIGAAAAAVVLVLVSAVLNPVVFRMGIRNSRRRPRQTGMVVAGLMVGTAIISGALVTGDSLGFSIQKATYDSFGEIDETAFVEGFLFFPQSAAASLASDPELSAAADAIMPQVIWTGAAVNPETDLYEPGVRLIGFDPEGDDGFGMFHWRNTRFDGSQLGPSDAILTHDLAERLGADEGNRIQISFTRPVDPVVPHVQNVTGSVTSAGSDLPVGDAGVQPFSTTFVVEANAVGLGVVLGWDGASGADLDLALTDPAGTRYANGNGSTGSPDIPAFVNVSGSVSRPVPAGDWTLQVDAKASTNTDFQATIVVLYAEYDSQKLRQRASELGNSTGEAFDPGAFEPTRHSLEVVVKYRSDGGRGLQFLDPNTLFLRLDTLQAALGRQDQVNLVVVSNPGDTFEGPDSADEVFAALEAALARLQAVQPDVSSVQALQARNDKAFWLDEAENTGQLFSVFLSFIASFSVIAGLLLIVNIFTMLAEERKSELGIGRAVGLRRKHLTRAFVYEGTVYAVIAAAVGTVAGLALAAALVAGFNSFSAGGAQGFPQIPFVVKRSSMILAFATGTLLTVVTVWLAARRASRINIVRAIRRIEEPEILRNPRSLPAGIALFVAGLILALSGWIFGQFAAQVLGPVLAVLGAGTALRRWFTRRVTYPALALGLFAYLAFTAVTLTNYEDEVGQVASIVRAIAMAICLVVAVVYNERFARTLAGWMSHIRGLRAVALPATSYPLQKKFRTGMTLSMFSVILLMVSMFSIFGDLFATDPEREMGGYHVRGGSDQLVEELAPSSALDGVTYFEVVPEFFRLGGDLITVEGERTGQFGPPQDAVWGIDDDFARRNEFRLFSRSERFATDEAAYLAVSASDDLVIVSYPYSTDENGQDFGHLVGETLQIRTRGTVHEMEIIGIQEQFFFKGIWVKQSLVAELFANQDTMFLFHLDDPSDATAAAARIEAQYRPIGMDAVDLRAEVVEFQQQFRQFFSMIQVFLGLGLVVGILSLGIVTARSVVERRQEIGMMRALGYSRAQVRRTFLVEMLTVVSLGVFIGGAVAILAAYGIFVTLLGDLDLAFSVPWLQLATIAFIAYAATTVATLSPIMRAARTPPAEALRYVE